jgi:hypothetical protein
MISIYSHDVRNKKCCLFAKYSCAVVYNMLYNFLIAVIDCAGHSERMLGEGTIGADRGRYRNPPWLYAALSCKFCMLAIIHLHLKCGYIFSFTVCSLIIEPSYSINQQNLAFKYYQLYCNINVSFDENYKKNWNYFHISLFKCNLRDFNHKILL